MEGHFVDEKVAVGQMQKGYNSWTSWDSLQEGGYMGCY
jgi:hypothetical protein